MTEEKKEELSFSSVVNDVTEVIESIIFSVFIVLLVFTYLFRLSDVSVPSMEPTLIEEDRVVISPLFYTPEQNDIVIVDSKNLGKLIVKRVVALEGQSVDIDFEKGVVFRAGLHQGRAGGEAEEGAGPQAGHQRAPQRNARRRI